ncbi:MAG: TIGR03663 family protein, partial [Dehalococcoidia bacterium]|nr:TIGR03663 family protein [Dehalococcoidia bacterium]
MTADSAFPRLSRPTVVDRLLSARVALNWEIALYVAIFALAFGLRFWDLGGRALHHDESIHAQWSWDLLRGNYRHSPVFHGPLYYHVEGFVFFLFGSSDYTSRVSAALFGTALLFLPLLMRRRLGAVGTMAAVALLAFSPTLVYYSRFFREDVYMAFFILLMAAAVWRYLDEERERWLIVFALGFTGAVTTKEGSFLVFAVFLVYLDVYLAALLARSTLTAREIDTTPRRLALTGSYSLVAWLAAAFWPFLPGVRRRLDWPDRLPLVGDVLVLLGTLTLPLLTPVSRVFLERFGIVAKDIPFTDARGVQKLTSRLNWERHLSLNVNGSDRLTLAALFTITTSAAAFVGLQWKPRVWAIAFGACALVYLTLMTSFWTNLDGLISGPWGSIDYWREQQHEYRGDQPWYYFYLLCPAYEFLPLAICVGGAWWSVVRGNAFSRFLVVWLVGQFLVFSWGSEKMPWLNTHLAVPACLLAAWTVHRAWQAWRPSPRLRAIAGPLLSIAAIALGGLAIAAFLPGGPAWLVVRCAVAVVAIAAVAWAARPWGRPALPTVLAVATAGALVLFSLRAMLMASFVRGDVPKDMLIYTQSSPDI